MSPDRCGNFEKPPRMPAKVAVPECPACAEWKLYNRAFPEYPQIMCPGCGRKLPVERVS